MRKHKGASQSQLAFVSVDPSPNDIDEVEFLRRFEKTIERNKTTTKPKEPESTRQPVEPEIPTVKIIPTPRPARRMAPLVDIILPPGVAPAMYAKTATPTRTTTERIRRPQRRICL